MRIELTILSLSFLNAHAQTNYYVSNSGSDGNTGTSAIQAWQTISKINGFSFTSHDTINLKSGDSWNEALIPPSSGLYFRSYSTGVKPIITGFQTQSGFTNVSGNIWSATATNAADSLNMVLINGTVAHKARYPNSSYLTFSSSSGDSILYTSLSGTPNYTGYEIAVRTTPWIIDIRTVASQSTGTLKVSPVLYHPPIYNGNGFFFQNSPSFIDTLNEYSFNNTTKLLTVYSVGSPTVLISTIDTLIQLNKKTNLSFNNIIFKGSNKCLFPADSANYLSIINCDLLYSGVDAISFHSANNISVTGDSLINILNNGVGILDDSVINCNYLSIQNNYFHNIGILSGMGRSGPNMQVALTSSSNNCTVSNNVIDSTGYNGMYFKGKYSTVKNNFVTNFCLTRSDGAGIYTAPGLMYPLNPDSGSIIRSNIIGNGIPNIDGTINYFGTNIACGIYADENIAYLLIDSNSIYNTYTAGIFIHDSHNIIVRANTVESGDNGECFFMGGPTSLVYSNTSSRNILFSSNISRSVFYRNASDLAETIDSNYYSRWPTDGSFIYYNLGDYTLPLWQSDFSYDTHSLGTPLNVTYDPVLFYTNPTTSPITVNIGQTYIDNYGTNANSFTIQPFKSVVLFKAINQIPPPAPPPGFTESSHVRAKIKSLP